MKTVVIWDELNADIKFFVLDDDYNELDQVYINGNGTEKARDRLNRIMYNNMGSLKHTPYVCFPAHEVKAGAKVIVAGFIP